MAAVLGTALAKNPADRFPSALGFANALGQARFELGAPRVAMPICFVAPLGNPGGVSTTKLIDSPVPLPPVAGSRKRRRSPSGWRSHRRLGSIAAASVIGAGAFASVQVADVRAPAVLTAIVGEAAGSASIAAANAAVGIDLDEPRSDVGTTADKRVAGGDGGQGEGEVSGGTHGPEGP